MTLSRKNGSLRNLTSSKEDEDGEYMLLRSQKEFVAFLTLLHLFHLTLNRRNICGEASISAYSENYHADTQAAHANNTT